MTTTTEHVRVLWLIKGLGLGGAEKLLVNALPYLDREAFEYEAGYFLPWKNALVPELEAAGLRVTCFGSRRNHGIGTLPRVVRYLKENRIQLVHAHLPWASIVGRTAAKLARTAAVVYTEHGCWDRLNPVTRWLNRWTLGMNDSTIAVSDEVVRSMNGAKHRRLLTITNGVDCAALARTPDERPQVFRELGIPPDSYVIVDVANLTAVKNHALLIHAFARLAATCPRAALVLVGQLRECTAAVRQLVAELRLGDRVVITGPRTDVPRIVNVADVFAMSSHSEGLPISLLEAMALGKPVVCTRVGGIPGVVADGVEGFLVSPGDATEMAERLAQLYVDGNLRQRMGNAGREKVKAGYDISVMVRKVEAEYRRLLEARRPGG